MVASAASFRAGAFITLFKPDRQPVDLTRYLRFILIMFRKIVAFIICSIAVVLPWKLRCIFSEMLGRITQFLYGSYVAILKYIVKETGSSGDDNRDK